MEFPAYTDNYWWLKWYASLVVTEEGVYIKDMVPKEYGGPQLSIEVVQRIIYTTKQGYLTYHRLEDLSMVLDVEKKAGVGYTTQPVGNLFPAESVNGIGPSSVKVYLELKENPWLASRRDRLIALIQASSALPGL